MISAREKEEQKKSCKDTRLKQGLKLEGGHCKVLRRGLRAFIWERGRREGKTIYPSGYAMLLYSSCTVQ